MRIYFLSCAAAALKLNGLYLGTIDRFERHVEVNLKDKIFCEAVPGDGLLPAAFFLDEKLLSDPPACMDVYRLGGDALIYLRDYAPANGEIKVIDQRRFYGILVTVFSQGRVYLSADGGSFCLTPLPPEFSSPEFEEITLAGLPVLKITAGEQAVILSSHGDILYKNRAASVKAGRYLEISAPFETCAKVFADCTYSFDGQSLTLIKSVTRETQTPPPEVMHFAFFEAVLTRGQYAKYLSPELRERAADLPGFLGDFVGVCVPPARFYETHDAPLAAGLIYPAGENIYDVGFFAVEISSGLISNIFPVEK